MSWHDRCTFALLLLILLLLRNQQQPPTQNSKSENNMTMVLFASAATTTTTKVTTFAPPLWHRRRHIMRLQQHQHEQQFQLQQLQQKLGSARHAASYFHTSCLYMMPEGPEVRSLVDRFQAGIGWKLVDLKLVSGRYVTTPWKGSASTSAASGLALPAVIKPLPIGYSELLESLDRSCPNSDIIEDWNCKGKFMYILLKNNNNASGDDGGEDDQRSIWITLGMTGRFFSQADHEHLQKQQKEQQQQYTKTRPVPQQQPRWYIELQQQQQQQRRIYYYDPLSFGTLKMSFQRKELDKKLASLAPDILNPTTTDETVFLERIKKQRPTLNICRILMDQSKVVSGIGNYILAEGLYRALIDPFSTLQELLTDTDHDDDDDDGELLRRLFRELQAVALESYHSQQQHGNDEEHEEFEYQCYGQTVCKQRGQPVIKEINGPHDRTIWYTNDQLFLSREDRAKGVLVTYRNINSIKNRSIPSGKSSSSIQNEDGVKEKDRRTVPIASVPGVKYGKYAFDSSLAPLDQKQQPQQNAGEELSASDSSPLAKRAARIRLLKELRSESWKTQLKSVIESDSFAKLALFVERERVLAKSQNMLIFPPQEEIFQALNICPFEKVKVVIVGQDPYHTPGKAHGLAFSVRRGEKPLPPSLQNIIKEAINDVGIRPPNGNGNLEHWARQGVLLLNSVLTVRQGEANSHANKGWEEFTDAIIERLVADRESRHCQPAGAAAENAPEKSGGTVPSLVFVLWGQYAQKKASFVNQAAAAVVDEDPDAILREHYQHTLICTSHPSPLGATKTKSPFFGSRCFSRANAALTEQGLDPIDWNLL